ncbi:oligosaccharide flippase family protein [Azospirillum sp. SYSU D00513]|uniref:oligosaccharide flippase family protein n=1 Tax=Azospirillum sp. SYSU D00513 TaxID=2812561 RepID=UPI001A974E09|nr:oligosaccharide flippase family protein [Azospirillum sp. SYSU D00513]
MRKRIAFFLKKAKAKHGDEPRLPTPEASGVSGKPPAATSPAPRTQGNFARDGAATIAMTLLTLSVGLLTGMLIARTLGPEGRGALTAVLTVPQVLGWLFGMGCGKAVTYFLSRDGTIAGRLFTTWVVMLLPVAAIAVVAGELMLPALLSAQSEETLQIARIYVPIIVVALLSELVLGIVLGEQRFFYFNVLNFVQPAGTAAIYLVLWLHGDFTVRNAVFAQGFMSSLVLVAASAGVLKRHGLARPDFRLGRATLWYALRTHGEIVSGVVTQRLDLLIIPAFLTAASVGYYALATSLAWLFVSVSGALATIVMPAAAKRGERGRELILKTLHFTVALGLVTGGGLFVLADHAIRIVYGEDFAESVLLLRILLPGAVLYAAAGILLNGLYAENRPFTATLAQSLGMIVTVVGLFLFLPVGGVLAAAIISTTAYTLVFLTTAMQYRRAADLDWSAFWPPASTFKAALEPVRSMLHRHLPARSPARAEEMGD